MYGTLVVEANTSIDMDSRTVALSDFAVGDVRYSSALSESETQRLQSLTLALFPKYRRTCHSIECWHTWTPPRSKHVLLRYRSIHPQSLSACNRQF